VAEHLPSEYEALSSNSNTAKKRKTALEQSKYLNQNTESICNNIFLNFLIYLSSTFKYIINLNGFYKKMKCIAN
jgi:hypothetical protein